MAMCKPTEGQEEQGVKPVPRYEIVPKSKGLLPDIGQDDPDKLVDRPVIKMENPNGTIPHDFHELPPEEQQRIMGRYRFMGVRLRQDVNQFQTVPMSRKTLEL